MLMLNIDGGGKCYHAKSSSVELLFLHRGTEQRSPWSRSRWRIFMDAVSSPREAWKLHQRRKREPAAAAAREAQEQLLADAAPTRKWLDRALCNEIPCKQLEQWRGKVFFSGGVPREQQTAAGTAKGMPVLESDEFDEQ